MNIKKLNEPVAENVKRIIKGKGLKQCAIAQRLGCTPQDLTDMLGGRRIIKVKDVSKFAAALDVSIGELFCNADEKEAV